MDREPAEPRKTARALREEAEKRGCYCDTWETKPETFEKLGYPWGYCGLCRVCGQPGHTRHFPGAVAFTDCWCERHWWRVVWLDPRASLGCLVWLAGAGLIGFTVWHWLR